MWYSPTDKGAACPDTCKQVELRSSKYLGGQDLNSHRLAEKNNIFLVSLTPKGVNNKKSFAFGVLSIKVLLPVIEYAYATIFRRHASMESALAP